MDYAAVTGIAVGLAADAFAVAVSNGAVKTDFKPKFAIKMAFIFGLFQTLMPVLGWLIGKAGEEIITEVDHFVAFALLCYIGCKMIYDSVHSNGCCEKDSVFSNITLLIMAVATSIDALATGVILPSAVGASDAILLLCAVGIIGVITFLLCLCGAYLGKKFGCILAEKAEIAGGIILILIGAKILVEHLTA